MHRAVPAHRLLAGVLLLVLSLFVVWQQAAYADSTPGDPPVLVVIDSTHSTDSISNQPEASSLQLWWYALLITSLIV